MNNLSMEGNLLFPEEEKMLQDSINKAEEEAVEHFKEIVKTEIDGLKRTVGEVENTLHKYSSVSKNNAKENTDACGNFVKQSKELLEVLKKAQDTIENSVEQLNTKLTDLDTNVTKIQTEISTTLSKVDDVQVKVAKWKTPVSLGLLLVLFIVVVAAIILGPVINHLIGDPTGILLMLINHSTS